MVQKIYKMLQKLTVLEFSQGNLVIIEINMKQRSLAISIHELVIQ